VVKNQEYDRVYQIEQIEVITSVQRRRRWSTEAKDRIVQETYMPGMSVSLVARQHGIAPNRVFAWRRLRACCLRSGLARRWCLASEYRALPHRVRELQRLLGNKTLENEVLRDALEFAQPKKGNYIFVSPRRNSYTLRRA
jgi:transposase